MPLPGQTPQRVIITPAPHGGKTRQGNAGIGRAAGNLKRDLGDDLALFERGREQAGEEVTGLYPAALADFIADMSISDPKVTGTPVSVSLVCCVMPILTGCSARPKTM